MSTAVFFLLSSITGVLEVGVVIYSIYLNFTVVQILTLVLVYQIGCFFPTNISIKKNGLILLGSIAAILSSALIFYHSFWLMLLTTLLISPCLQTTRSLQKSSVNTGVKRLFRIIGFGLAPLFSPAVLLAISIVALIIVIIQRNDYPSKLQFPLVPSNYIIMVVHQMHYFSYAYIVLILASKLDRLHGFLTAIIFMFGWLTYTSAQYIFSKGKYFKYLIGGHILLVILISGIAVINSEIVKVILWILTGFGGGTVFCIKEIVKSERDFDKHALESAENYGHILGVLCSIVLFTVFGNINAPIYFAAMCAASTVLLAVFAYNNQMKEGRMYD